MPGDGGVPRAARNFGRASDFEPSRLVRVRFAVAAADSRSGGTAFHRRYRFENGGHAQDAGARIGRSSYRCVDGSQTVAAPRDHPPRSIFSKRIGNPAAEKGIGQNYERHQAITATQAAGSGSAGARLHEHIVADWTSYRARNPRSARRATPSGLYHDHDDHGPART